MACSRSQGSSPGSANPRIHAAFYNTGRFFLFFWKVALFFSNGELSWHDTNLSLTLPTLSRPAVLPLTKNSHWKTLILAAGCFCNEFYPISESNRFNEHSSCCHSLFLFQKLQFHSKLNNEGLFQLRCPCIF